MNNGKAICKTLKEIRLQVAQANGIDYEPARCDNEADCAGTCPQCEHEVRYLERQLTLRRRLGKAIQLAGIGVSLAALTACHSSKKAHEILAGIVPYEYNQTDSISNTEPDSTNIQEDMLPQKP